MALSENSSPPVDYRRIGFAVALGVYGIYALRYIFAASVSEGGERWFLLWDDAMISMQYGRNLAEGHGWVWNAGGEAVQGFTNFGVTLLMAGLHTLPLPEPMVALAFQLFNLAVLVGILFGVHRLAGLVFPGETRVADAAAILTGLYGPLAIWGLQGADFAIQAGIALVAILGVVRARKEGRAPSIAVFLWLSMGILVREDFALVFATVWIWCAAFAFPDWKAAIAPAAVGVLTVAFLLVFSIAVFGDPLPNTYYLKATGNPRLSMWVTGASQLLSFYPGISVLVLVAFVVLGARLLFRDPDRVFLLLVSLVLVQFAYFVWVGGDWVVEHTSRYLMVAMPFFILVIAGGSAEFLARSGIRENTAHGVFWLQMALFVWFLNPPETLREWHLAQREPMYRAENAANLHMGLAICDATTPDTKVGIFWAGLTPYVCPREYIDVFGRTDSHIAHRQMESFAGGPGHAKTDWEYIFQESRPDVLTTFTPQLQRRGDFSSLYCVARLNESRVVIPVRKDSLQRLREENRALCDATNYPRCIPCGL